MMNRLNSILQGSRKRTFVIFRLIGILLTVLSPISGANSNDWHDTYIMTHEDVTTLRDLADNKPLLLVFFSKVCAECRKQLPELKSTVAKYEGRVRFYGVNTDTRFSKEEIDHYVVQMEYPFNYAFDVGRYLQMTFKVPGTPTYVLIDAAGENILKSHSLGLHLKRQLQSLN